MSKGDQSLCGQDALAASAGPSLTLPIVTSPDAASHLFLIKGKKASATDSAESADIGSSHWEGARADIPGRLERYARRVKDARQMAAFMREHAPEALPVVHELERCFDCVGFKWDPAEDAVKLGMVETCKRWKLCASCACGRMARHLERDVPFVRSWMLRKPNLRAYMATFTQPTDFDVLRSVKSLKATRRKMWEHIRKARNGVRGNHSGLTGVLGGRWNVEIKVQKNGAWHTHMHELWIHEGRLNYDAARLAWEQAAGEERWCKVVELEACRSLRNGDCGPSEFGEQLGRDLCEVTKYPIKFTDMSLADRLLAWAALPKREHLTGSFGEMYGIDEEEKELEFLEDWNVRDYLELVYKYVSGKYVETEVDIDSLSKGCNYVGK